ncbi:DUF397 domain-containing protein [Streptomyces lydicus]|uniref:DUF397 domain-containing protein n=1 Tax=Streptomyces lydicus TaxID=47763 RepID=UPI001012D827|nr:DUF397 domain-containing protein [Streptomyces lydicus]MCZ1008873.1 DUF397 domain-containing protein [Streptomyces lydicus]
MKTVLDLTATVWRKSSYSDGGDNNCVEVSDSLRGAVPVRDSKNPTGGVLLFPTEAWSAFIGGVMADRLR